MSHTDYVLLAVIAISAALGAVRGFLREAIALAAWIIGLWMAWQHQDWVAPYLGGALAAEPIHTWAARTIVFVGVLLLGTLIGAIANHFIRTSLFSGFDRLLGFGFGLLRGVLILAVFGMLGQQLRLDSEKWWTGSKLMPYVEGLTSPLRSWVGEQWQRRNPKPAAD